MAWKKSPAELIAFFDGAMAPFEAQRKPMFGYPAYFVNDQMFAALHQDDVILRLSEPDRAALISTWDEAAPFEPMAGRPMREYVVLPESLYNDPEIFREWVERSRRYALSLPPKEPKKKKRA